MNALIPDDYAQFQDGQGSGQSFNFTSQLVAPQWSPGPTTVGSSIGVPPATYIAGMDASSSPGAGANAYGAAVAQRSAGNHPVFWAIALFMAGIVMLGLVAHLEVKRRG